MNSPIKITDEMIRAGIGELMDYEMGDMSAGEAVGNIFTSMVSFSSVCESVPEREPKAP